MIWQYEEFRAYMRNGAGEEVAKLFIPQRVRRGGISALEVVESDCSLMLNKPNAIPPGTPVGSTTQYCHTLPPSNPESNSIHFQTPVLPILHLLAHTVSPSELAHRPLRPLSSLLSG